MVTRGCKEISPLSHFPPLYAFSLQITLHSFMDISGVLSYLRKIFFLLSMSGYLYGQQIYLPGVTGHRVAHLDLPPPGK